jgi:hypothetical protein
MDDRASAGCRALVGVCVAWALALVAIRLLWPLSGARLVLFFAAGAGLFGFGFLTAARCRMAF